MQQETYEVVRSDILLVQLGARTRSFATGHDLWYLYMLMAYL